MDLCLSEMSPVQIYSLLLTQEMGIVLAVQRMKTLKYKTISSRHFSSQNISTIHFLLYQNRVVRVLLSLRTEISLHNYHGKPGRQ